ncbi:MAG: glycosyltransferase family 4 protein [Acholeplasmataceae bacterium]
MKIAFITAEFLPARISSSYIYEDLFTHLIKQGHSVDVYCSNPIKGLSSREIKKFNKDSQYNHKGINIHTFRSLATTNSYWMRLFNYIFVGIKLSKKIKKIDIDCAILPSFPPVFFQRQLLKRLHKMKVTTILNLHDLFPDNSLRKDSLLYKVMNFYNVKNLCSFDFIVSISDDISDTLISKGVDISKIRRINLWEFSYSSNNYDVEETSLDSFDSTKFNVCYIGNIGRYQNISMLLDLADSFESDDTNFVFVGDGPLKQMVIRRAQNNKNIQYFERVTYDQALCLYRQSDVNIISLNNNVIFTACPSKTSNCIGAKKPILAIVNMESKYAQMILDHKLGLVADPTSISSIMDALCKIKDDVSEYTGHYVDFYEKSINLKKWNEIMICLEKHLKNEKKEKY